MNKVKFGWKLWSLCYNIEFRWRFILFTSGDKKIKSINTIKKHNKHNKCNKTSTIKAINTIKKHNKVFNCVLPFYCVSLCSIVFHCVSLCFTVFHCVLLCLIKQQCWCKDWAGHCRYQGFMPPSLRKSLLTEAAVRVLWGHHLCTQHPRCSEPFVELQQSRLKDHFVSLVGSSAPRSLEIREERPPLYSQISTREYGPLKGIFKVKQLCHEWCYAPNNMLVKVSETWWINADMFLDWGRQFITSLPKDDPCPHVIPLDGHSSCVFDLEFLKLMRNHNLYSICVLSCTHHPYSADMAWSKTGTWWAGSSPGTMVSRVRVRVRVRALSWTSFRSVNLDVPATVDINCDNLDFMTGFHHLYSPPRNTYLLTDSLLVHAMIHLLLFLCHLSFI